MNKEKEEIKIQIKLRLRSFKVLDSRFRTPPARITKKSSGEFSFEAKEEIDIKNNLYKIIIHLDLFTNYRKKSYRIGHITTLSIYEIKDLPEFSKELIPHNLLVSIYAIAISSTRGAFSAMSRGIIPDAIQVPLIDPNVLVPNWNENKEKSD